MDKYKELYEGILDRLAKKAAAKIRGAGERVAGGIEEGAEKKAAAAKAKVSDVKSKAGAAVSKAKRSIAKGTIEKTPFGFANKAKRAIKKLNKEFEFLVTSAGEQEKYLKGLANKIAILKDKIADRYQDTDDENIQALISDIETFQKNANAIASAVKATKTRASNLTGIKESKDVYEQEDYDLFCEEWDRLMEDLDNCE